MRRAVRHRIFLRNATEQPRSGLPILMESSGNHGMQWPFGTLNNVSRALATVGNVFETTKSLSSPAVKIAKLEKSIYSDSQSKAD